MKQKLYHWQLEALEQWNRNNYHGTIKAITGSGKTYVGIEVLNQCIEKTLIVVPTIALLHQWVTMIHNNSSKSVSCVGDGNYDLNGDVVVAVVNSIREREFPTGFFELLIVDEIHRICSEKNFNILDKNKFKKVLGLSATPERIDNKDVKMFEIAPIVYEYGFEDGIKDNVVSNFEIIDRIVYLKSSEDITKLEELNSIIKDCYEKFGYNFRSVLACAKVSGWSMQKKIALAMLNASRARKYLLQSHPSKDEELLKIVNSEGGHKILIFTEFIEIANRILINLKSKGFVCGIYSSKEKSNTNADTLQKFKDGKIKILIAVKCLDEGLNVPDVEIGIVHSGNSTRRQMTQRIGRIVRFKDKRIARIYQIIIGDSIEEKWANERLRDIFKLY